jgi:hypothetical protein
VANEKHRRRLSAVFLMILAAFVCCQPRCGAKSEHKPLSLPSSQSLMLRVRELSKLEDADAASVYRDACYALLLEGADREKQVEFLEQTKDLPAQITFYPEIRVTAGLEVEPIAKEADISDYTLGDGPVNQAMLDRADADIRAGNFAAASSALKEISQHSDLSKTETKTLHALQAWIDLKLENVDGAVNHVAAIKTIGQLSPEESIALTWIDGRIAYLSGNIMLGESLEKLAFEKRLRFRKFHWAQFIDNFMYYADAAFENGHYIAAQSALCKVISMTNTNQLQRAEARTLLSLCYFHTGHKDLAAYTLNIAMLEIEPNYAEAPPRQWTPSCARAYVNASRFERLRGNHIRALRYLNKAKSIVSQYQLADTELGREVASEIKSNSPQNLSIAN